MLSLHESWPFHKLKLHIRHLCLKIANVSEDLAKPCREATLYRGFLTSNRGSFIS